MKKSLMIPVMVFLSFCLVSITGSLQAQWQEIIVAPNNSYIWLYDIQFVNENTGYVVGRDFSAQPGFTGFFAKSTDKGISWIKYSLGSDSIFNQYNYAVSFINENTGFVAGYDSRIFKTTNGGLNWQPYPAPNYQLGNQAYYCFSFLNENTGYVGGRYGILARTTDAGITWDSIPYSFPHSIRKVWFANENTGYVSGQNGYIHKTIDGAATWNAVYIDFISLTSLSFINANTGYTCGYRAGDNYRAVLKTTNGSISWDIVLNSPDAGFGRFESVEFVNALTGYVVGSGPAFKTIDGGSSWIEMNISTVGTSYYNSYFFDANTGFVAGVQGKIYKTETGGVVNIQNISTQIPDGFSLYQNFPNPFNPTTNIKFSLPTTQYTILKVFDALGREVATLVNETLQAGSYNYQFSIDDYQLSSGVYFYTLRVEESYIETKKMVVLR